MNVTAIIPTRGDVDVQSILDSLPEGWQILFWANGSFLVERWKNPAYSFAIRMRGIPDLGVYGRYAAIEHASGDLIYTQDDDVIVSDPQELVEDWKTRRLLIEHPDGFRSRDPGEEPQEYVVCNMPEEFRPHYPDGALVGFGAVFHRDLPDRAFQKFFAHHTEMMREDPLFLREADRVFTMLTPRMLVDIPKIDLPWASGPNRLWKQEEHIGMREEMLRLAREARDA